MHYSPHGGLDKTKFTMVALKQEYQSTMGLYVEPSFKDIKLLNRLYCTSEYPHKSTLSKSINLKCDVNEYELDYGECKNGGFPDPLNDCKCRCPDGYGGEYCTKYEYEKCMVVELTAKVEVQNINSHAFKVIHLFASQILCFFVIKPKETNSDRIKAKRTLIEVRKMEGFECRYPCLNNYIEIKFLKDKTATGARICCDKILRISSEEYTEVLIMKKGNIGEYDISYKAELAPSQDSSNCKEVRESIWDPNNLQTRQEMYELDEKLNLKLGPDGKWIVKKYFGPNFCIRCHIKNAMIVCFYQTWSWIRIISGYPRVSADTDGYG
uniref:Peptidase M12A domain-containing protein n=1 Tax=Meloidogyne incognita TaxID=6306 RepID=A0A914NLL6_MELIC